MDINQELLDFVSRIPKYYKGTDQQRTALLECFRLWRGLDSIDELIQSINSNDNKELELARPEQPIVEPKHPGIIDWNDFNARVSRYFIVGEVCQWDSMRIVDQPLIRIQVVNLAKELDKIREAWGGPIGVTSWYRPALVNKLVGGAKNSQHIKGHAADIHPIGKDVVAFQSWLDKRWYGALGYGANRGFVHIDMRNGKGFEDDGDKGVRWNY